MPDDQLNTMPLTGGDIRFWPVFRPCESENKCNFRSKILCRDRDGGRNGGRRARLCYICFGRRPAHETFQLAWRPEGQSMQDIKITRHESTGSGG